MASRVENAQAGVARRDDGNSPSTVDPVPSFIETQFPVSRLSKESYKERSAKNSQTLTGLGKWWGRKPLILVRAIIIGLLLPASQDPRKDRDVFLALLTMDDEGLWRRKDKSIPLKEVRRRLTTAECLEWFAGDSNSSRPRLKAGMRRIDRARLQRLVFERMSYGEKLKFCKRPEHLDGPTPEAWKRINKHLGTNANSMATLVQELGMRQFGRAPHVGDAFCGGGSVPFEAARIGCEAYGSDLNPVAALLTWGALNVVGGGEDVAKEARKAQAEAFEAVDRQVTEWRIEHNVAGWRADAFLYCAEAVCPECGWQIPLAPSWVVGRKPQTIARLVPEPLNRSFSIEIQCDVGKTDMEGARSAGTVRNSRLECPNCKPKLSTPISAIRGDKKGAGGRGFGLRRWENVDLTPQSDDVFQERLYCVRWRLPALDALLAAEQEVSPSPLPHWTNLNHAISVLAEFLEEDERREITALRARDWKAENRAEQEARGKLAALRNARRSRSEVKAASRVWSDASDLIAQRTERVRSLARQLPTTLYRSVNESDLKRESTALDLLRQRFIEWQAQGYIPSRSIVPGAKTDELIRTRGWTHWHHLFMPRQLLLLGTFLMAASGRPRRQVDAIATILGLSRCVDYNSKLCRWHTREIGDKSEQTFSNQALNTLYSACPKIPILLNDNAKARFFGDEDLSLGPGIGENRAVPARFRAIFGEKACAEFSIGRCSSARWRSRTSGWTRSPGTTSRRC